MSNRRARFRSFRDRQIAYVIAYRAWFIEGRVFCRTCAWWKRNDTRRGSCWLKMEAGSPQPVDQFDVCADHAPKVVTDVQLPRFSR